MLHFAHFSSTSTSILNLTFVGFHWTPSNTSMLGPTPNDSSIAVRTSAQLRNKVPIGYNGTPQIHLQNCPFPFDDHHQNLIHPFLDRSLSPAQTASGSNQPFCHNSHVRNDRCSSRVLVHYKYNSYLIWQVFVTVVMDKRDHIQF